MKIKQSQLKNIIFEEISKFLREGVTAETPAKILKGPAPDQNAAIKKRFG